MSIQSEQELSNIVEQGDPSLDSRAFRRALGQFATGVTIATAMTKEGPIGLAVNSFSAISLDPPLISWSIRNESRNRGVFTAGANFAISVLAEDQMQACAVFASPADNQFDAVQCEPGTNGSPLLTQAIAQFECTVENTVSAGDHQIIVGRVSRFVRLAGEPLVFCQGQYRITEGHPQVDVPAQYAGKEGALDVDPMFVSLLRTTERAIWDRFEEHREQLGLGAIETLALNLLAVEPHSIEQLAFGALVGTAAVEDTVRDLISRGLVMPVRGGFGLSYEGRKKRKLLQERAKDFNDELTAEITAADMAATRRVLLQLLTA